MRPQDWSSEVGRGLRIGVRRWGGASGLEFGGRRCLRIGVRRWGGASGLEFGGGAGPQDWSSEVGRGIRIGVLRSVPLRASIRVSPDFALRRHSSPSFGS